MNLLTPLAVSEPPSPKSRPRTALERLVTTASANLDVQRLLRQAVDGPKPPTHEPDLEQ